MIRDCVTYLQQNPAALHPEEKIFSENMRGWRKRDWINGRIAARRACLEAGYLIDEPILSLKNGAPSLKGMRLSISHKEDWVVVIINDDTQWELGVDLENDAKEAHLLTPKIFAESEILNVPKKSINLNEEILLRFSLKEAIYKATSSFFNYRRSLKNIIIGELDQNPPLTATHYIEGKKIILIYDWCTRDNQLITFAKARAEK